MRCKSGPVRLPQSSGERRLEKKNDLHFCKSLIFKWYHQESNRGHKIFSPLLYQLSYGTIPYE